MGAVKEALERQTGLNPKYQHDVLKRMKRFGVTSDLVWEMYCTLEKNPVIKPAFLERLDKVVKELSLIHI